MTVARFNRMNKKINDNQEDFQKVKIKNDGKLPSGLLIKAQAEITDDIQMYLKLKQLDSDNEKFPIMAFKRRESEKEE
jgi:hypothetical protein